VFIFSKNSEERKASVISLIFWEVAVGVWVDDDTTNQPNKQPANQPNKQTNKQQRFKV
jgi:hypothetical protein